MARAKFVANRAGLQGLFLSQQMRTAMHAAGEDVAEHASSTAPRRTGALADSFTVEDTTARVRTRSGVTVRASGRVVSNQSYAVSVEFGHGSGEGANTLGRIANTSRVRAARAARRKKKES